MAPVPYNKPALTHAAHLQLLKNRGLHVENDAKALFLLENIGYYRLSGYWYPMLNNPKSQHQFKPGSTFNSAFNLYCFDRELRKLISAELEKIEIAVRSKMIYTLSHSTDPFWFNNSNLFVDQQPLTDSVNKLRTEYRRSDEQFIKAFRRNYTDPLPPSWMIFEISSFGNLSYFYKNLIPGLDKRAIANYFGLDDSTFQSWLHSIVYVRNVCAHHTRLWNRVMSISPAIPITPSNPWLNVVTNINSNTGNVIQANNRTYYILSMIIYFMETINPRHTIRQKFFKLLEKYPNVDVRAMGFTPNWRNEVLWTVKKKSLIQRFRDYFNK